MRIDIGRPARKNDGQFVAGLGRFGFCRLGAAHGPPPAELVGVGIHHMQEPAAQTSHGTAQQQRRQLQEQIIGRKQQAAENQAERDDVGPDGGKVEFQQAPARGTQISACADHRTGRPLWQQQRGQGGESGQRSGPACCPQRQIGNAAPRQQGGIRGRQGKQHVVRADSHDLKQQAADPNAPVTAEVEDVGVLGIDQRARRVGRIVAQQRRAEEQGESQQGQREQVRLETACFEHNRDAMVRCDSRQPLLAAG